MTGDLRCITDLGPVQVAVTTDHSALIDYLRDFYPIETRTDPDGTASWSIEARLAAPEPGMTLTPWRVGYRADPGTRRAMICSTNPRDLAITTRKAIREVLLDYCEARGYAMLHASAVADDERVIVVVGDKGSGKTTLALNATLTSGYRYLSNDHLILYRGEKGLVVTSLPTPIPVKVGTYFDYAGLLGEPWENEGVALEAFGQMAPRLRYGYDRRLLYTYRGLGQTNPSHTPLDGRQILVVLASYAPAGGAASTTVAVPDPVAALWPHVRFDWVFDPELNTHHLPRDERNRDAYARDAAARLAELTAGSSVVAWQHQGQLAPLLSELADRAGGQR